MSKQQRMILFAVAGAAALFVLYRWQMSRSSSGSATPTPDPTQADYAQLAGQEQADTAALQNTETSDVANLSSTVSGLQGQEGADVATLQGQLGGIDAREQGDIGTIQGQFASLATPENIANLQGEVAAIAAGQKKASPSIATHKGGSFYNYYKQVTGKAPPARVAVSDFIYQAWTHGIKATALAGKGNTAPQQHSGGPGHPANVGGNHTGSHPAHQAPTKHAGTGAIAPSTHETKPNVNARPKTTVAHTPTHQAPPQHKPASTAKPGPKPHAPAKKPPAKKGKR